RPPRAVSLSGCAGHDWLPRGDAGAPHGCADRTADALPRGRPGAVAAVPVAALERPPGALAAEGRVARGWRALARFRRPRPARRSSRARVARGGLLARRGAGGVPFVAAAQRDRGALG